MSSPPPLPPLPPPPPHAPPSGAAATGTAIPLPPPAATPDAVDDQPRVPRAGELTVPWRTTVLVTWVGIVLVYASVWRTARTMGLSTWWLGPPATPRLFVVQLLPFVAPLAMVIAASRPTRHLPIAGIVASLVGAGIAAGDIGRFDRIALLELVAAGAGLLISIASLAGVLRSEPEIDRSIP
jgi:hypothetical protein